MCRDLGLEVQLRIHSDATAAIGICNRRGLGRVRHLAVADLWVQDRLRSHDFGLLKVAGSANPADLLTKYLDRPLHEHHIQSLDLCFEEGRPESAAQIGEQIVACCLSRFKILEDLDELDPEDVLMDAERQEGREAHGSQ